MRKSIRTLLALLACFCIATVLAQLIGVGYLWSRGALSGDRFYQVVAIIQGVDLEAMAVEASEQNRSVDEEQIAFDEILKKRALAGFDLDLRENAYDRGISQLKLLEASVKGDAERFDQRRQEFAAQLNKLQEGARDTAIQDLQQMIETMSPVQAKNQILLILEEPAAGEDTPMHDILTILKQMSPSKQKKLFAEFEKEDEDIDNLHVLLDQIRRGAPDTTLIDETRQDINQDTE